MVEGPTIQMPMKGPELRPAPTVEPVRSTVKTPEIKGNGPKAGQQLEDAIASGKSPKDAMHDFIAAPDSADSKEPADETPVAAAASAPTPETAATPPTTTEVSSTAPKTDAAGETVSGKPVEPDTDTTGEKGGDDKPAADGEKKDDASETTEPTVESLTAELTAMKAELADVKAQLAENTDIINQLGDSAKLVIESKGIVIPEDQQKKMGKGGLIALMLLVLAGTTVATATQAAMQGTK